MANMKRAKRRPWQPEPQKQSGRHFNNSFYQTPMWRKFREEHLRKEPMCRQCAEEGKSIPGNVVDHIKRINPENSHDTICGRYGEPLDHQNAQTLCAHHHAVKSGKERHQKI